MSGFHEVRFPTSIARGATGGPERRTDIVSLASGREERNSRWAHSKRRYNAGYGVRTLDDIRVVIAFFEERRGRLHGFRFRDPFDDASSSLGSTISATDQPQILAVDRPSISLTKTYGTGDTAYVRPIAKPVSGTVKIAIDGSDLTEGTDFTVDYKTGDVLRVGGSWSAQSTITAGFRFDVPVRFDNDRLDIDLAAFEAGSIPDIPLVEIRP